VAAKKVWAAFAVALSFVSAPAAASEVFGGLYAHDTNVVTKSGLESGVDLELGWRGERMHFLHGIGSPSPHVLVSLNSAGDTHFAAAGVSWKIGHTVYFRPGVGVAIHTGPSDFDLTGQRIYLGSRVLFEPEVGIGYQATQRFSVEASWVHLSHAMLAGGQNPGLDTMGIRLNYKLR
jgi:hypothetical protein